MSAEVIAMPIRHRGDAKSDARPPTAIATIIIHPCVPVVRFGAARCNDDRTNSPPKQ